MLIQKEGCEGPAEAKDPAPNGRNPEHGAGNQDENRPRQDDDRLQNSHMCCGLNGIGGPGDVYFLNDALLM